MIKKTDKITYGKTIYYTDELKDDFEKTNLKRIAIPENFKFQHTNWFYNLCSNILYFVFAVPILRIICLFGGIKVKGKENLKELNGEGCFIYSNHTSFFDVFDNQVLVFPFKKTHILGYTDALSNKLLKVVTPMLGHIPIPDSPRTFRKFQESMEYYVLKKNHNVLIYPEAHIWPYYTKIRPFISTSFKYPAKLNRAVLPITACYRKSKLSNKAKITLYIGKPIYPKLDLSVNENKEYLRDECYKTMCETAKKYSTYEYVKYVKKVNEDEK